MIDKSDIQREITPTQNLTYTGHYKWDENQCDAYNRGGSKTGECTMKCSIS
jgi:hypothetical protein